MGCYEMRVLCKLDLIDMHYIAYGRHCEDI